MWTNFAKTGNPTPHAEEDGSFQWLTVSEALAQGSRYMLFDDTLTMDESEEYRATMAFWDAVVR